MQIHTLALAEQLYTSTECLRRSYFAGDPPHELYHYTKECETVCKIITNRCIWAKPLSDQKDELELDHGIAWVEEEIASFISSSASSFVELVLRNVPLYLRSRKPSMFITCFCGDGNSSLHWERYGKFRLTLKFPNAPQNRLTSAAWECETWYQPVIYDHAIQKELIRASIDAVASALELNVIGEPSGPWIAAMASGCARDVGMMLLKLVVGFKNEWFTKEKEWRLISCPKMRLAYSDPTMPDEAFSFVVKSNPRRLELQLPSRASLFEPLMRPGVPFSSILQCPSEFDLREHARIRALLSNHGRTDIDCS